MCLRLDADLESLTHRRCPKNLSELADLFLVIATDLARLHVSFLLPQRDRYALARVGVCQQKYALESFLRLRGWYHALPIDLDCFLHLARLHLNRSHSCMHRYPPFIV